MSFLSMMEERLPPGFRFHPRDEELVSDYLAPKARGGSGSSVPMMVDVDLNKCEPWDLPDVACVGGKEWYFYSLRDRKYATGQRTNRATASGYWKATGKDRQVVEAKRGGLVGTRKTLVFYQGRAPKGRKTDWVMHEFRLEEGSPFGAETYKLSSTKEDWVLCRVSYKSRSGLTSKTSMENCYDDTGTSSLPPLMDTFINFEQDPLELDSYEQVPCFSNYPLAHPPQYCPNSSALSHVSPAGENTPLRSLTHLGDMPGLGSYLNTTPCEKKAIKAVLDHLTKLDGSLKMEIPHNLAEGSSESYLITESSMWNPF